MKVLVVGSGSREHAICWKLAKSPKVSQVICSPGNPGIGEVAALASVAVTDAHGMLELAQREKVELVVVGPEAALAAGVVDTLRAAGFAVAGPTQRAAQIEASKAFAKEIMDKAGVPTASYHVFTEEAPLREYCARVGAPLVLKADGLASGKGVFVITEESQFEDALSQLFGGLKADKVVAEEFLEGVEVSCIFATNGESVIPLAPAHDYKRLLDNDMGPNTGGMGSVCPSPRISKEELDWVQSTIAQKMVVTMRDMGIPFSGFLYAGLMVPDRAQREMGLDEWLKGVRVLEFNARLGDPECQAILVRLSSDLVDLCEWIAGGSQTPEVTWSGAVSTCVVVASDGYPENVVTGDRIDGLELVSLVPGCAVFHAATKRNENGRLVTAGGRTLSVVGVGNGYEEARGIAYKGVDLIQMRGRRVRRDIGAE